MAMCTVVKETEHNAYKQGLGLSLNIVQKQQDESTWHPYAPFVLSSPCSTAAAAGI